MSSCKDFAEMLLNEALKGNYKISCAESCTGGLIGGAITEISGSSEIFNGSAVTYSNEAKRDILGVDESILKNYGAVSSECALAMAKGALKIYNSDFAISVTGIAGPEGGTNDKPVGTVWFGISTRHDDKNYSFMKKFSGDRQNVRAQTIEMALKELLRVIKEANMNNKKEAD